MMFWPKRTNQKSNLQLERQKLSAALSFKDVQFDVLLFQQFGEMNPHSADFMRFMAWAAQLEETTAWTLQQELEFLQAYLQLWQTGKGVELQLKTSFTLFDASLPIQPLISIAPIQNALIHGYNHLPEQPLKIKFQGTAQGLQVEVSNRVNHYLQNQADTEELKRFQERLAFCYPDQYQFFINSNSRLFKTTLIFTNLAAKSTI